jgi:hypothetical protein
MAMPYAIIRGKNGRRHEVDFGDAPVRVQIYSSEETVEIFIEADFETLPDATLARGLLATALPPPVFHRLDRASFAWRTDNRFYQE